MRKFLDMITNDVKEHPERLRTTDDVWDTEWDELLEGVSE